MSFNSEAAGSSKLRTSSKPSSSIALCIGDGSLRNQRVSVDIDSDVNKPMPYDETLLRVSFSLRSIESVVKDLSTIGEVSKLNAVAWAVKALTLTDLTTLAGDDTPANVRRLCVHAAHPFPPPVIEAEFDRQLRHEVHAAAVCVYPARVKDALTELKHLKSEKLVKLAAVATGFPTGQYGLQSRLLEISQALVAGANEIDVVINRQMALSGNWQGVYNEVVAMRHACADRALLKTILSVGELGSMENVYKAAMVCMMAGADFIKTSTGKESARASLSVGLVIIYAIREFRRRTCQLVGLMPAGGVRTAREAIAWMTLVKETLGNNWLRPRFFRFGATALHEDVVRVLYEGFALADREAIVELGVIEKKC